MPAKAEARLEILGRVGKGLAIITKTQVNGQIGTQVNAVLYKTCEKPLRQVIAIDPKVDRLLVVQHIIDSQLIKRQSSRGPRGYKCKRTQDCCAGFAARAARPVMNHAAAKTHVVHSMCPRQRVRKLQLVAPDVRG